MEISCSCSLVPETLVATTTVDSDLGTRITHDALPSPSTDLEPHPRAITLISTSTIVSNPPLRILTFDQRQPDETDFRKTILGVFSSFKKAKEGAKTMIRRLNHGRLPPREYELKNSLSVSDDESSYELWVNGKGDKMFLSIWQCVLDRMELIG